MAAITGATTYGLVPSLGRKQIFVVTPSSADSADTIDVSDAAVTGGETLSSIDSVYAYDKSSGDSVTCTFSGTTITLDAAGGTTNHTYCLTVVGRA